MQQVYVESLPSLGQVLRLEGDEARYLGRALRARVGERFRLAAEDGRAAVAQLQGFEGGAACLRLEAWDPDPEETLELHLALCPPRGEALDEALDMAVQLGVRSIRFWRSERTLAEVKPEKVARRVREAARQCKRAQRPEVLPARPLLEGLVQDAGGLFRVLLSERGGAPLRQAAQGGPRFLLLIGPEGGFSAAEAEAAVRAGWMAATLGPRLLRVPTAVAAAMAGLRALQPG